MAVEDAVRTIIRGAVGSLVVGEERGGEAPADGAPCWLVDPICGTRNFASGVPLYSINLAFVEGGQLTVAVVGDPSADEIQVIVRPTLPSSGAKWAGHDRSRHQEKTHDGNTHGVSDVDSSSCHNENDHLFFRLCFPAPLCSRFSLVHSGAPPRSRVRCRC